MPDLDQTATTIDPHPSHSRAGRRRIRATGGALLIGALAVGGAQMAAHAGTPRPVRAVMSHVQAHAHTTIDPSVYSQVRGRWLPLNGHTCTVQASRSVATSPTLHHGIALPTVTRYVTLSCLPGGNVRVSEATFHTLRVGATVTVHTDDNPAQRTLTVAFTPTRHA